MWMLLCVLVVAAIVDIFWLRIPNLCITIGMCLGVGYQLWMGEASQLGFTALRITMVFLLLYPFYLCKGLGAGDIKLFMMIGCYLNTQEYVSCLMMTMFLAGACAIVKMICFAQGRERLCYLISFCRKAVLTGTIDTYEVDKKDTRKIIRLSVPAVCSVLMLMGGWYQ